MCVITNTLYFKKDPDGRVTPVGIYEKIFVLYKGKYVKKTNFMNFSIEEVLEYMKKKGYQQVILAKSTMKR